jgi:hypothetical protein
MTDLALRSLERAAFEGDPYAEVQHYRARLRAGEFGEDAGRLAEALEVVMASGEPCGATLEVLGFVLSGELAHGSWVKILSGSPRREESGARCNDGLLVHTSGSWWCVQHWRTGHVYEGPPGLQLLDHVTICAAGVPANRRRRGLNRYVSEWRAGFVYDLPRALEYFAQYLDTTYRPGVGLAIWEATRKLSTARGRLTRLTNMAHVGPLALQQRNEAKAEVEEIEAEIKTLEGSTVESSQLTD